MGMSADVCHVYGVKTTLRELQQIGWEPVLELIAELEDNEDDQFFEEIGSLEAIFDYNDIDDYGFLDFEFLLGIGKWYWGPEYGMEFVEFQTHEVEIPEELKIVAKKLGIAPKIWLAISYK